MYIQKQACNKKKNKLQFSKADTLHHNQLQFKYENQLNNINNEKKKTELKRENK